ncbi:MAG: hypothetical protein KJ950_01390 [Proteobacteria bacterium]|nr:hypothetical protein [Pseudomonadota bacterium]MBU1687347.1 hypothetical protein [Pseudomonadota bacterium]
MWYEVREGDRLLALIVRNNFQCAGTRFFTPDSFSQQLGYMSHPKGHIIEPHSHLRVPREVEYTLEVLFIRKGRLQVDFYDDDQQFLRSEILEAGDVILLAAGGHGFTALEDLEMFEVKQGPYVGTEDKHRFDSGNC